MREAAGICVGIVLGIWTACSPAMTITGQVVDHKARPVQGAEVVVGERKWLGFADYEVRTISPVVRTDVEGRFSFEPEVPRQRDVFVVARKAGLAHAWEWLNCSNNTVSRKHFPLVLEPAGVLAGQVVDAEGKPVAGAEVQALPVNTWGFSGVIGSWDVPGPKPWFAVTTDAQGRFRFEQLGADVTATLQVQAPTGGSRYVFHPYGSQPCGFEVGRSDIQLVLPREGTIKGRVVDGQGRPVANVELTIRSGREYPDITNLYVARKTRSDAAGIFALEGVPESPHLIGLSTPEQGLPLWTGATEKVSVKAGTVAETTIRVSKGGILEVTALDARTRRPVAGAHLSVSGQQGHQSASATANAKGVVLARVPADSYTTIVSAPQHTYCQSTIKVIDGQTVRREAQMPPHPRASGQVLGPQGRPAADVAVVIHPFGDHVYTDAQGRFEAGLDGQYGGNGGLVVARDAKTGLAAAVPVDNPSRLVELRLGRAWTLTGRVAEPNGAGIPASRVSLHMSVQNCLCDLGVQVLTDPTGRFEMKAIPPVDKSFECYRICANAAGYGQAHELRTFLRGAPGASVDLGTIRLLPANASVSGVVVDAKGVPAAQVPIFTSSWPGQLQPHKITATNEKGEFTVSRLCQGRIDVQANFGNNPGGASRLKTRVPTRQAKIVLGKNLTDLAKTPTQATTPPQLTDLCPYLLGAQTDGVAILLCLVDVAQPSSRQYLADLARMVKALAGRGIIAVVVQTAPMPSKQDSDLLQANRNVLAWCMAEDDFDAQKAAWGIESLPWLILTDRRHAVHAGGFPLSELDNRVEAVTKEGR